MKLQVTRTSLPPFEEFCEEIRPLWESHWVTNMGGKHEALESALRERIGCGVTLFSNGHLALEAALQALDLPAGSEVITTPFTFVSTTHAIVRCGLVPVFCDVRASDGTMDPELIEGLITERTSAILPVHVYGHVCDAERIGEIALRHGLKVLYDAAHAFGVRYRGVPAGSFGDASVLSFHATKVFSTVEGGAVCWHDPAMEQRLKDLRNFGIRDEEHCAAVGGNAKMDELRASMGLCNLRHLDEALAHRREISLLYRELLPGAGGPVPFPLAPDPDTEPNWSYFPVLFPSQAARDAAFDALAAAGIGSRKYFWPLTCDNGTVAGCFDVPVARGLSSRILCLPLSQYVTPEEVKRVRSLADRLRIMRTRTPGLPYLNDFVLGDVPDVAADGGVAHGAPKVHVAADLAEV